MNALTEKEQSILSIAKTLHNVHGPKFFMIDAYLSMTTRQYRAILHTAQALVSYGYLEWREASGGGGVRITEAGVAYLEGVTE